MRTIVLASSLLALAAPSWSTMLVSQYVFQNGVDPVPNTFVVPHLSSSGISHTGITLVGNDSLFFSGNDWPVGSFGGAYFEVTLTPDPDYLIDFSTVEFHYVVGSNETYTTGLFSSVDGYTTNLGDHIDPIGIQTWDDSLAVLGVQSSAVTFRLYGFVDANTGQSGLYAGNASFFADSDPMVFTGVPEPGTLGMLAGGALLLACRRGMKSLAS